VTSTLTRGRRPAYFDTPIPEHERLIAKYLRMSKDFRGDGLGIDRQDEITDQYLDFRQLGGRVVDTYKDTVSATSGKPRLDYIRLVRDIVAGRVNAIACVDLDRLVRLNDQLEELIKIAEQLGHLYVLTGSGWMDLANEDDQVTARIRATIANHETKKKATRQRRASAQGVDMGKPPGRRAFGYQPRGLELHEEESKAVRWAYEQIMAGGKLAVIARTWNAAGHRTAFGKSATEWRGETVRKVLLNPRNAGIRAFYGEEVGPGTWPAIVDEKTFRLVAAILNDPSRATSGGSTTKKYIGGGLYACGVCGGDVKSDWRQKPDGSSRTRVYVCRTQKHLTRAADPIDALVTDVVEERLSRPDLGDAVLADIPELGELTAKAKKVKAAMKEVRDAFGDGDLTRAEMKEQLARQEAKLADIARRQDVLMADLFADTALKKVTEADDPVAYYRSCDPEAQQRIIRSLMTVTLLKGRPGIKIFDPETVVIAPKLRGATTT
jgi:DNA invertase Pin-like site-specific DNA recombinase